MGSDRSDGDDNVVSIFDRGPHHESRYRGILESRDPEFQNLVERYLSKVGSQNRESAQSKAEIGMGIMKYETTDQMDLLIKFAILEIALGYGSSSTNNHDVHENLMCIYFKKSMINFLENRQNAAE
jgi:hypothetical protein